MTFLPSLPGASDLWSLNWMYPMFPMVGSEISVLFKGQVPCPKSDGKFLKPSFSSSEWVVFLHACLWLLFLSLCLYPGFLMSSNRASELCVGFSHYPDLRSWVKQSRWAGAASVLLSKPWASVFMYMCVPPILSWLPPCYREWILALRSVAERPQGFGPGSSGAGLTHWQTFGSSAAWTVAGRIALCLNCFISLSSYFIKVSLH